MRDYVNKCLQDLDVDSLLSKLFKLENGANDDKADFLKIFQSIDKSGDGRCSRKELTVDNTASFKFPSAARADSISKQVFLKKLFYTPAEIDEFIRIADVDGNGEVRRIRRSIQRAPW